MYVVLIKFGTNLQISPIDDQRSLLSVHGLVAQCLFAVILWRMFASLQRQFDMLLKRVCVSMDSRAEAVVVVVCVLRFAR